MISFLPAHISYNRLRLSWKYSPTAVEPCGSARQHRGCFYEPQLHKFEHFLSRSDRRPARVGAADSKEGSGAGLPPEPLEWAADEFDRHKASMETPFHVASPTVFVEYFSVRGRVA